MLRTKVSCRLSTVSGVQVLDEIGIDAVTGAVSAPSHKASSSVKQQEQDDVKDEDLETMLAQLRS